MQQNCLMKTLSTKFGEQRSRNLIYSFAKPFHVNGVVKHETIYSFRAVLQTRPHDRSPDSTWVCFDLRGRSSNGGTASRVTSRRQHYANLFHTRNSLPPSSCSERPSWGVQRTSDEVSATPQRGNHISGKAHQEFQKGTLVLSEMNVTLHRHHIKLFMMQLSI